MKKYLLLLSAFLITSCASTAKVSVDQLTAPRTISVSGATGEAASYVDELVKPLTSRGFVVGTTTDPSAIQVIIEFDPNVFHTEFVVKLRQKGKIIAETQASNSGWGTGIARSSALPALAQSASSALEEQLNKVNVVLVSDSSAESGICQGLFATRDLDPIRGKVVLFEGEDVSTFKLFLNDATPTKHEIDTLILWNDLSQKCLEKVDASLSGNQSALSLRDAYLNRFNQQQVDLSELVKGRISYGDFAKKQVLQANTFRTAVSQSDALRASAQQQEAATGLSITQGTQQSFQGQMQLQQQMQNSMQQSVPTFTSCSRVGNQLFCNSN